MNFIKINYNLKFQLANQEMFDMKKIGFLFLFIFFCSVSMIASDMNNQDKRNFVFNLGAIIRGDTTHKNIALVFPTSKKILL